jgi:hypothetical protein
MIRQKALVYILIWMELNMKVNGKKINNMARAKRLGQMEHCTRETMYMGRNMELASSYGQMDLFIMANSSTIILKVKVNTNGLMVELLKVIGKTTRCTVKECLHGPMVGNMKENIYKIKSKVWVHFSGLMEEDI